MKTIVWRRILGVALAALLLVNTIFSDFVFAQSDVQAEKAVASSEEIYVGDFNLFTYRADVYLKDDTICNRIIKYLTNDAKYPSQKITEHLADNFWFQTGVQGWEKVHWAVSPSEILDGAVDQKGYYTAIILSVFKAEMKSCYFIESMVNKVESAVNKYLSNLKKWAEEADTIERLPISKNQILTTIPVEQQKMIQENLSKEFKKNHPILNDASTVAEGVAEVFKAAKTLGEAVLLMESYICLTEISENMKAVLTEMYNQCPIENVFMKSALLESASAAQNLKAALGSVVTNTMEKGLASGLGTLIDEGWKKIIESNPYAAAFKVGADVGAWLGDTICSILFSTDKTVEQYEKMKCLDEFTALLRDVSKKMGSAYLSNKSTELSENYFASIEVLFSAANLSCKFAEDYGKILYEESALGWVAISEANYQSYINSVKSIERDFKEQEGNLFNCYLAELEEDYPDIYAILMGLNTPDPIPVTGIAFDYDIEKLYLDTLLFPAVRKPVIYPENATNKKITYTSSDPTILDVNEKSGEYYVKQAGTVTITATSKDGGFTDTVTVQVMEGKDGAWGDVSLPGVVDRGKCGENVYWVLYENGKLVISGKGEMEDYVGTSNVPWYSNKGTIVSVVIESGVTSIGGSAFSFCYNLSSIKLPSSVASIGQGAFSECSSLINMELSSGVLSIGEYAFSGCRSLSSIELPSSVNDIKPGAFSFCSNLTSINVDVGNPVYDSREDCNAIIETENSRIVLGCKNTVIPYGVTSIGDMAFSGCENLSGVELPSSVTRIGDFAFSYCTGIIRIGLPFGVTSIGYGAFCFCKNLRSVELSSSVTSIGGGAFEECPSLSSIELPSSVTSIGSGAFTRTEWLASKRDENPLVIVNGILIDGRTCGEEVIVPSGVTSIGHSAFFECISLSSIELPSSVSSIGDGAFSGCENLSSIELPSSVSNIGDRVFSGCDKLTIYGYEGSCAQRYAVNYSIPFKPLSPLAKISAITLKLSEVTLDIRETLFLEADITPIDAENKHLKWNTDDVGVAIVENGLVTAIGEGSATVTAESQDGSHVSASCNIIVQKSAPVQKEKENQFITGTPSYSKTYGNTPFKLDVTLEKGNGTLSYTSSNLKVAEVSASGEVKITGTGNVFITVTASETEDYKKCEYQVSINVAKAAQRISGTAKYSKPAGSKPFRLNAKRTVGDGKLSYLSANRTVAIVSNNGTVTIKKPGNTLITVTAASTAHYNACTFCINLIVTAPKKGTTLTDSKTKTKYKVTKKGKSVEYAKPKDKKVTKVSVPATVTISGVKYNVTAIGSNAFSGCKKLKIITIGKNVEFISTKAFANCTALGKLTLPAKVSKIGKQAFSGCKKLKDITIKSTKLTSKSIGAKAFQGIYAKAIIKVPKAKKAAYQKLLKSKGISKKVKIK